MTRLILKNVGLAAAAVVAVYLGYRIGTGGVGAVTGDFTSLKDSVIGLKDRAVGFITEREMAS